MEGRQGGEKKGRQGEEKEGRKEGRKDGSYDICSVLIVCQNLS